MTRLEELAIQWNQARIEALGLKYDRAREVCENEAVAEPEVGLGSVPPCWKTYITDAYTLSQERLAVEKWCEPCKRRQVIHEKRVEVVKRRGALERSLQRAANKASRGTDGVRASFEAD